MWSVEDQITLAIVAPGPSPSRSGAGAPGCPIQQLSARRERASLISLNTSLLRADAANLVLPGRNIAQLAAPYEVHGSRPPHPDSPSGAFTHSRETAANRSPAGDLFGVVVGRRQSVLPALRGLSARGRADRHSREKGHVRVVIFSA
eukprot:CAMPEP_0185168372 /NCGR_PEP_ID=MMETSP1139-20130426/15709_1 /TAXON_ID=298111 /ORGANISM="Pavlova sp., Strain CCMP459" /LENGTH=146 /DNA_ID=CAMNT_0027733881 /DNA_START=393 /DNA_END=834 /DNA_ORIENTATION=+